MGEKGGGRESLGSPSVSAGNELPAQMGVTDENLGKRRLRKGWIILGMMQ